MEAKGSQNNYFFKIKLPLLPCVNHLIIHAQISALRNTNKYWTMILIIPLIEEKKKSSFYNF